MGLCDGFWYKSTYCITGFIIVHCSFLDSFPLFFFVLLNLDHLCICIYGDYILQRYTCRRISWYWVKIEYICEGKHQIVYIAQWILFIYMQKDIFWAGHPSLADRDHRCDIISDGQAEMWGKIARDTKFMWSININPSDTHVHLLCPSGGNKKLLSNWKGSV